MQVAVTGGAGYLGRKICDELIGRGWQVTSLDTGLFAGCILPGETGPGPATVRRDIRDVTPADFDGFAAVVHLAGLCNDPLGDLDPDLTMAINHAAAVRVAGCARDAGVRRMVCASSCSVYGAAGEDLLVETSACAPVTPYARAKLEMERDIAALATASFVPVFLRPATVYGLSPAIRFDLVVNNLVAWALATGEVRLKSDGAAWRPILHVDDVASAFASCLAAAEAEVGLGVFNLVDTGANFRVREIAETIAAELPGTVLRIAPDALRDRRNYRVSGRKLARVLGPAWPRRDLRYGIAELATSLRAHPVPAGDFEGSRFQRLAHLRAAIASRAVSADLRPAP